MASFQEINERLIPIKQYITPTTGSTVNVNTNGYVRLIVDPAGSLVALTIAFPGSPQDGDTVQASFSQTITTLTMNGGTILSSLTTTLAGSKGTWVYDSTSTKWHLIG